MSIAERKYVAFTTYTSTGVAKATPVWIADLGDGRVGFVTPSTSWKVRRLAHNAKVTLQPCDGRGKLTNGSEPVTGTAVVSSGDYDRVNQAIKEKYGWQRSMIGIVAKVSKAFRRPGRVSDTAVLVTLD